MKRCKIGGWVDWVEQRETQHRWLRCVGFRLTPLPNYGANYCNLALTGKTVSTALVVGYASSTISDVFVWLRMGVCCCVASVFAEEFS